MLSWQLHGTTHETPHKNIFNMAAIVMDDLSSDSVKILHFYQVLEQNNAKQKSYAKSFEIVLSLAYDRMPPAARVVLRFPKISQSSTCMDHAILHRKPFGNPLLAGTGYTSESKIWFKTRLFKEVYNVAILFQNFDQL